MERVEGLKYLDGCKGCRRHCQFNNPIAGPYAIQSKSPYGCNSFWHVIKEMRKQGWGNSHE
jgi:hypothetical protein